MSKGNPIIRLRLSRDQLEQIDKAIAGRENIKRTDTNTLSEWIRGAIDERLAKLTRGRGRKESKKHQSSETETAEASVPSNPQDSPKDRSDSDE